jgi:hypothetical protein
VKNAIEHGSAPVHRRREKAEVGMLFMQNLVIKTLTAFAEVAEECLICIFAIW